MPRSLAALLVAAVLLAGCAPVVEQVRPAESTPSVVASGTSEPETTSPPAAQPATPGPLPSAGTVVKHGPRTAKLVALTFDLCATPNHRASLDTRVVAALRARSAAATFMMGGLWADAHPAEAKELASDPLFEIGNHGQAHLHIPKLTDAAARAEIADAQAMIERIAGVSPVVFRYPYDEYDRRARAQLSEFGLTGVSADLITGDPDKNISGKRIAAYVVHDARPGSIVLMHANGNGVHTAEALPALIDGLRKRGFTLVTMSELLGGR